jgi:aspartokinase/homoserine dehydrogenase 1
LYQSILAKSISIVTCNKIAASSSYDNYYKLKTIAITKRVFFKFESNVGAGLPIIQTISNLVKTGDQIRQIDAVVSGSLNFIFNSFCNGMSFSEAVLKAMEMGYTEPDPLIDLRGIDVSRKLLILVREAGIKLESSDIVLNSYLPHELPDSYNPVLFPEQIKEFDEYFEKMRERITKLNRKIRMVAQFEDGKASISLKEVDSSNPLYVLEGNDNVVSIHTMRYSSRPLVIKGAGAGAEVTASGIFSDVLSILNN